MFDVFSAYATDEKKEIEGTVISLGGDATITVARTDNVNYLTKMLAAIEKHEAANASMSEAEAKEYDKQLLCETLADSILLNFEGLSYKGEPLPYSKENAVKVLSLKDFRKLILKHANDIENFRVKKEAEVSKN